MPNNALQATAGAAAFCVGCGFARLCLSLDVGRLKSATPFTIKRIMNEYIKHIEKQDRQITDLKKSLFDFQKRHQELETNFHAHTLEIEARCKKLEKQLEAKNSKRVP
jgi:Spindle pole body component BBP1, C-terminal